MLKMPSATVEVEPEPGGMAGKRDPGLERGAPRRTLSYAPSGRMAERTKATVLKTVLGLPSAPDDHPPPSAPGRSAAGPKAVVAEPFEVGADLAWNLTCGARSMNGIEVRRCAYCAAMAGAWKAAHWPALKEAKHFKNRHSRCRYGVSLPSSRPWSQRSGSAPRTKAGCRLRDRDRPSIRDATEGCRRRAPHRSEGDREGRPQGSHARACNAL